MKAFVAEPHNVSTDLANGKIRVSKGAVRVRQDETGRDSVK